MAYKKFALYFKWIDGIVCEINAKLFTHSFLSASFTHLNHIFAKKELSVYIERKRI